MAEKIIPDVEFFAQEIVKEAHEDLQTQRLKIAERLINFSPEKISELHLQDWYNVFWKLVDLTQNINDSAENKEKAARQIYAIGQREANPIRQQYCALALLLFGRFQEFQSLANQGLWSKNLREDYNTYQNFNKLSNLRLVVRAHVRRKQSIKNFLFNKYSDLIKKYARFEVNEKNCPKVSPKNYQIYFSWLQGKENLPPVVQCCYNSLKMNAGRHEVVFIDEQNYSEYISLPEHVLKKFSEGKITRTHFSDILRINLLEQYGGLWLDSTVLVTEPLENYKHFWKLPYYTQKFYQDKSNDCPFVSTPSYGRWASFIQGAAILHNPLFAFEKEFLNKYWYDFDSLVDYVLIDYMMDLAYDNMPIIKKFFDDVPINNDRAWNLLRMLNLPYEQYPYDKIFKGNFLNKLSWKAEVDLQIPGTVFREIQRRYAPETIGN